MSVFTSFEGDSLCGLPLISRRTACAAVLAILATGVASVPPLTASTSPTILAPNDAGGDLFGNVATGEVGGINPGMS
jgi:hypothetical protein